MRMLLVSTMLLLAFALSAAEIRGKVVAVIDGDTVTVLDELDKAKFQIRLSGIDAPEKKSAVFGLREIRSIRMISERETERRVYINNILGDKYTPPCSPPLKK